MEEERLQDILHPGNKLMRCQMTMELWPTGSSQALSLESGIMPGESRAAHVRLAPLEVLTMASMEAGCMPLIFPRDPEQVLLTLSQCNHCRSHLASAQSSANKYNVTGNKT